MAVARSSSCGVAICYLLPYISSLFYLPNDTTVRASTSIQLRRAGQQGSTRTLTAALKRVVKHLLGTYFITQYYKHDDMLIHNCQEQKTRIGRILKITRQLAAQAGRGSLMSTIALLDLYVKIADDVRV